MVNVFEIFSFPGEVQAWHDHSEQQARAQADQANEMSAAMAEMRQMLEETRAQSANDRVEMKRFVHSQIQVCTGLFL